jgi:hypothetical protein
MSTIKPRNGTIKEVQKRKLASMLVPNPQKSGISRDAKLKLDKLQSPGRLQRLNLNMTAQVEVDNSSQERLQSFKRGGGAAKRNIVSDCKSVEDTSNQR